MEPLQKRKRKLLLFSAGIAGIGLLLFALALLGIPIRCVFHEFTGLSCPGCGNTRAVLALLRLDFAAVLRYNLLFPVQAGYLIWVFFLSARRYLKEGRFFPSSPLPALDWIFLASLLVWGIVRNLLKL